MFVRRYLLLLSILFPVAFVAESSAGEGFSVPYYNESEAPSLFSPGGWLPSRTGFKMPERFRDLGAGSRPRTTNPWSLPIQQWAPATPRYLGPEFRENDYSKTSQYMKQTGEQNTVPSRFPFNGQPNSRISSQQPVAEPVWQQPNFQPFRPNIPAPTGRMHNFQQNSRFVTPDILDALNRQQVQTQQIFPLNAYQEGYQDGSSKKQQCCQNKQRRMKSRDYTRRTYQPANKQSTKQAYRYSNGSTMPFTMDAGQLNRERLLYMGDSLPTVPDAAISGLPPMNIFEPLPPVLSGSGNDIDWGMNRFGIGPYGDFLQQ